MQGLSATILLLTLATFLDELFHLARVLSSEHTSKPHLSHRKYHSSTLHARPPIPRWWRILAAAGSPVTQSESRTQHITSEEEPDTDERDLNADEHTTQTRWAIDVLDTYPQLELQRLLEVEEEESEAGIGSNAPMGWTDPRLRGGQMLDLVFPGLAEPLNVIISGLSDLNPRGLLHYAQTLEFSTECLGIRLGMPHVANLGDALIPIPNPPSP